MEKAFLPFILATPVLFTLGASLAYFVVMPTAFKWFLGFEGVSAGLQQEALPAMGDYLDLVMRFILAFGISFLLPVLLLLLNRAGLVSRAQFAGARRYVIDDNFRCPAGPLILANRVIAHNRRRAPKRLQLTRGFNGDYEIVVKAGD